MPWEGVRAADQFGAVAPQAAGGTAMLLGDQGRAASEDCLFLNVVTPACDDGARPVMVWIHGGGFVNGSSSTPWYDGTRLATRGDVVVVGINYRLGALGLMWLGDLDPSLRSSGVNALLDQVAALRWVQENIAAFGGDPGNVTIFGESAGAMSVGTLLALPSARGLFHRAIAQSGAATNTVAPEVAAEITATMMSRLNVTDLEGLLAADAAALVDAGSSITADLIREPRRIVGRPGLSVALAFEPVVDGEWLPAPPLEAIRSGAAADVPLLIGTNRDEWNLFRILSPGGLDHAEGDRPSRPHLRRRPARARRLRRGPARCRHRRSLERGAHRRRLPAPRHPPARGAGRGPHRSPATSTSSPGPALRSAGWPARATPSRSRSSSGCSATRGPS